MAKVKARPEKSEPILKTTFWSNDLNVALMLAGFAFVLYARSVSFGYALDDVAVLHGNEFVKQGFKGFGKILSTFYWQGNPSFAASNSGLFRPLSLLMFATEWQLVGNRPGIFHFVQVVLYALTSMQLFYFLRDLVGKQYRSLSIIAVLIWIALPIHTEVVANLKSADEILSLLFSLLGLRWLLKWNSSPSWIHLVLSGVSFFLAMLSKEAAALMLPIGILMLMMFRQKKVSELILPGIVLAGFALIWFAWHFAVIHSGPERITYDYRDNALLSNPSMVDQTGTAIGLQGRYWLKMLIGYPLSWSYAYNEIPVNGFADFWPWISLIGIGCAVYFASKKFRTEPLFSFSIIFYFVTIALTSNIFFRIGDIFAERFTFTPSIGFCILLAFLIVKITNSTTTGKLSAGAIALTTVITLLYFIRTEVRASDWKDESTLFISDAEHSPNSGRVQDNVGVIYLNAALGEKDELKKQQLFASARDQYKKAYDIDPKDFQASEALGQIMYHLKDFKASVEWSRISIAARRQLLTEEKLPLVDDPTTCLNMGDAFIKLESYDSSIYYYTAAVKVLPSGEAYLRIGDTYLRMHDTISALSSYQQSVNTDSAYLPAWDKIGNIKGMRRDFPGSNEAFEKMARIDSLNPNPWKMLYTNYSMMGDSVGMKRAADEYFKRGGQ